MAFSVRAPGWAAVLNPFFQQPHVVAVSDSVNARYLSGGEMVAPTREQIFRALELTDLPAVKVVIIGQDPYHTPGMATGLAFGVPRSTPAKAVPPSLVNMFMEINGQFNTEHVDISLTDWAEQGVLLLNTTLTVRCGEAFSHGNLGWGWVVDEIIRQVQRAPQPVVWLLLGRHAQSMVRASDVPAHQRIVMTSHPSPLGAYKGFIGSKCFDKVNQYLVELGSTPIVWGGHRTFRVEAPTG